MERIRRRWWTWSVTAVAVLVIFAGSISGIFQLAVMALPDYRDDLSGWVTQVAGRPVQIGGINLVWRGINPRLDLSDITLYDEDGGQATLTAERLTLGFSLMRLLTRDYSPQHVVMSGLTLGVQVDPEGQISVAGFEKPAQDQSLDWREWLRQFERFKSVRLERCTVDLADQRPGHQTQLRFALQAFEVDLESDGFNAEAQIKLPASYGDTLKLEAHISGKLPEPESWAGDFSLQANGLLPQPWLRGRVAAGTRVAAEEVQADVYGKLNNGQLSQINGRLDSGILLATRAGRSVETPSLSARLQAVREDGGWRLGISRFKLNGEDQLLAQLHFLPLNAGGFELNAEAETVHLDHLLPWLQFARDLPGELKRLPSVTGTVNDLNLSVHHADNQDRYSLRANLNDISLPSEQELPGFNKLNGEIAASENGGSLQIEGTPPVFQLPAAFASELVFESLNGELQWHRVDDGLQFELPKFDWKIAGISGRGQLGLLMLAEARHSPTLNLDADFSVADITALKAYMPKHWGEGLKSWLGRAIEAGRVPRARLEINGPLADFPFHLKGSGAWKLDLDAANARLAYAPNWPAAENVKAKLHFSGNGLQIEADSVDLAGNHADHVVASIKDFNDHSLSIEGSISGDSARFYNFLRNSPLHESLATLVTHTRASGPASLALHLDIPLNETAQTTAVGTVALDGVQMFYGQLREPFNDIHGVIAFDHDGVSSSALSARFEDLSLSARIEPRVQTRGVILADFQFSPNSDGSGVSAYVPALLRNALTGASHWRAELPLGTDTAALSLTSDMTGINVALPKPLSKRTDEAIPIQVLIGGADANPGLQVRVAYGNRLSADIAIAPAPAPAPDSTPAAGGSGSPEQRSAASVTPVSDWSARRVSLKFGAATGATGATTAATTAVTAQDGLHISGNTPEFDLIAWSSALGATLKEDQPGGMSLRSADLQTAMLLLPGQFVRDIRMLYAPAKDGWSVALSGTGAEGEVLWNKAAESRLKINLARLEMEKLPASAAEREKPASSRVLNPADWPLLDFSCALCKVDGADLGQIKFNTVRILGGQRLEYFTAESATLEAHASGEWLRLRDQSSGKLKFDLATPDFTSLLKSLGYAQNLSAKTSRLSGELDWSPATAGLAWEKAHGKIGLNFENGTLKAVDPGAGRVLGLLNFYALPRRLTLDFRDVVKSGLAFDKINGSFDLGGGNATTEDLQIDATALRMELRGRVGLVARDYDQRVTVYPDMTSGITLGAALLGGPPLAALAFIAQEVLDKPIEQATQLTYQVTGSWDNPEVKRVESGSQDKPAQPPPAAVPPVAAPATPKRR